MTTTKTITALMSHSIGLIHAATGNVVLVQLLDTVNERIAHVRMINSTSRLRASMAEHLQIIAALQEGDSEAASEAMRAHLANARESLLAISPEDRP